VIERVRPKTYSQSKSTTSSPLGPPWTLLGQPQLLEGEDAAAYDQLLARVCAAVKPVDIIDEIFITDVVSLEWEVLRWRRLQWSLIRARGLDALKDFLAEQLDYDLYSEHFADYLAEVLQDNLPEDESDSAQTLARKCAQNDPDADDKVNEVLAGFSLDMDDVRRQPTKQRTLTSDRKIRSNRENARVSTGPTTAQGRTRAARNALRHGLSLPLYSDRAWSEEVEALAREIAGTDTNAEIQELARRVAEAQIDLRRVRYARHQLLTRTLAEPYYDSRANTRVKLTLLGRLLGNNSPDVPLDALMKFVISTPQGPQKLATILSEEAKQLLAMNRYERRALSRRKFAIRAFDAARRQAASARE
jgi:hypothetical protein